MRKRTAALTLGKQPWSCQELARSSQTDHGIFLSDINDLADTNIRLGV